MLLILGLGFAGLAVARAAAGSGLAVAGTARDPSSLAAAPVPVIRFAGATDSIRGATHLLVTAPPGEAGDPVLAAHRDAVEAALAAGMLRWVGYISTTGVYGDRGGADVDEATPPAPEAARSHRRLAAEQAWRDLTRGRAALDLMRAGGIYGSGRSAFDDLRTGTARRILKPGHRFSRIHAEDIARAALAALTQQRDPSPRVLHLVDDEAAESAAVVAHAAMLLGVAPPSPVPFETARATMSPMALSFWRENRHVTNVATKAALRLAWRYPTYREGLAAILDQERREGLAE